MIKRNAQNAEFPVVIPEQSKLINPVDTAILTLIPEDDPHLTTYLNEPLRMNKPEQQNNAFWFPTLENNCENEDHTLLQIRVFRELIELREKEKINAQDITESQTKSLSVSIDLTRCFWKPRIKQLRIFWLSIIIFS